MSCDHALSELVSFASRTGGKKRAKSQKLDHIIAELQQDTQTENKKRNGKTPNFASQHDSLEPDANTTDSHKRQAEIGSPSEISDKPQGELITTSISTKADGKKSIASKNVNPGKVQKRKRKKNEHANEASSAEMSSASKISDQPIGSLPPITNNPSTLSPESNQKNDGAQKMPKTTKKRASVVDSNTSLPHKKGIKIAFKILIKVAGSFNNNVIISMYSRYKL